MTEYDNTDTFALFKHDKKGNDKAPDYSGYIHDANGKKRRIACWLRDGKSGKFMSGKVEDYREQQSAPQPAQQQAKTDNASAGDGFDDIPFAPIPYIVV